MPSYDQCCFSLSLFWLFMHGYITNKDWGAPTAAFISNERLVIGWSAPMVRFCTHLSLLVTVVDLIQQQDDIILPYFVLLPTLYRYKQPWRLISDTSVVIEILRIEVLVVGRSLKWIRDEEFMLESSAPLAFQRLLLGFSGLFTFQRIRSDFWLLLLCIE